MTLRSERFKRLNIRDQSLERIESLADLRDMYALAIRKDLNKISRNKIIQRHILNKLGIKLSLN